MSEDEKPPSWAEDPALWQMYQRTVRRAADLGWGNVSCGWTMQPEPHGEMRIAKGRYEAIVVVDRSPAAAVLAMDWLLDQLERADYDRLAR